MRRSLYPWIIASVAFIVSAMPLYGFRGGPQSDVSSISAYDSLLLRDAIEKAVPDAGRQGRTASAGREFAATLMPYSNVLLPISRRMAFVTQDRELAAVVRNIGRTEQARVEELQQWQRKERPETEKLAGTSIASFRRLMQEVVENTRGDMRSALVNANADVCFVSVMIAQGEGAVDMAKIVLIFEGDKELRAIARKLVGERQAQIRSLRSWLNGHTTLVAYR